MFRSIVFSFICFLISSCFSPTDHTLDISSPDENFKFSLNAENGLKYKVNYLDSLIIDTSNLGFKFDVDTATVPTYLIEKSIQKRVNDSWRPVYGERDKYPDTYNELLIELKSVYENKPNFNLRIRAYKEGVAFRYEFPDIQRDVSILDELTEFNITRHAMVWSSMRAQSEIVDKPISKIEGEVERPLLIEIPGNCFMAIGEAALVDFSRMKFTLTGNTVLKSTLSGPVSLKQSFVSPWRYIMADRQPGKLVEHNYLLLNLNEPNKIPDNSWIKPGKVLREVTLTTQGGIACVDFAAKHNMQFVEFDAGWYGPESDTLSDATTVTVDPKRSKGPLDLHKVIDYAKSKDIGIILYVNHWALERQLDEILPLYQSWGISGIKYGFVNVGSQYWTSWLHHAVRKAADHELMVDIHDEYRPTGYSRTFPNLMTQEGIRGDEESPDNSMVLNTLFTRMIAGAGDHTNCYMAPRVHENMGSHASQMAKAICIYSPWQFLFWYDRPQGSPPGKGGAGGAEGFIPEIDDLEFYEALPTVWDDTRVLDGYPGKFAIVARRSGDYWFVGVLNGSEKKNVEIPLDFLDPAREYTAKIFSDDKVLNSSTNVKMESINVDSKSVISSELLEMNGLALIIRPE